MSVFKKIVLCLVQNTFCLKQFYTLCCIFLAPWSTRLWCWWLDDSGQAPGLLLVGIFQAQEVLPQWPAPRIPSHQWNIECREARTATTSQHPLCRKTCKYICADQVSALNVYGIWVYLIYLRMVGWGGC